MPLRADGSASTSSSRRSPHGGAIQVREEILRHTSFTRKIGAAAVAVLAGAGLPGALTPASASHTAVCNVVVGGGTFTLTHDIGPCPADGLRVESDNVVINLNGFSILGDGTTSLTQSPNTGRYGDAGIRIEGVSNVKVTDSSTGGGNAGRDCTTGAAGWGTGKISGFDVGIAIAGVDVGGLLTVGSGGHTVEKVTIKDNISTAGSDYGDGIHILNSSNNTVVDSRIIHNGSLSGVTVAESPAPNNSTGGGGVTGPGTSDNNVIGRTATTAQANASPCDGGNVISDNDIEGDLGLSTPTCGSAGTPLGGSNQDDGVRLEPGVTNNKVENNIIERNGLDGVAVFFAPAYAGVDGSVFPADNNFTSGNLVKNNVVRDNGFHEWVGTGTGTNDPYPRANCTPAQANSPSPDPGPGWAQKSHRKGDGIRVFGPNSTNNAINNTVQGNTVCGNAASGVRVDGGLKATDPATATGNRNHIQGNTSGSGTGCDPNNQQAPTSANFDMFDFNKGANVTAGRPACNSNNWGTVTANTFGTENTPACIV